MKHQYILLCFLFPFLFGCECEDVVPTVVTTLPDPFLIRLSEFGVDDGIIFLQFSSNDSINLAQLEVEENILFEGLDDLRLERSSSPFSILLSGTVIGCPPTNNPPCSGQVTITLKGTGENAVQSVSGQILDGDKDGSDGGDQVEIFEF